MNIFPTWEKCKSASHVPLFIEGSHTTAPTYRRMAEGPLVIIRNFSRWHRRFTRRICLLQQQHTHKKKCATACQESGETTSLRQRKQETLHLYVPNISCGGGHVTATLDDICMFSTPYKEERFGASASKSSCSRPAGSHGKRHVTHAASLCSGPLNQQASGRLSQQGT